MRNIFKQAVFLALVFFSTVVTYGQEKNRSVAQDDTYGKGGKKVTITTRWPNPKKLNKIDSAVQTWIVDPNGKLREEDYESYSDGYLIQDSYFDFAADGKIEFESNTERDTYTLDTIFSEYSKYGPMLSETHTRNDDGSWTIEKLGTKPLKFERKTVPHDEPMSFLLKKPVTGNPNCLAGTNFFLSYSYLNGNYGNRRESFISGLQVSVNRNISSHIGLGLSASTHRKEFGKENFSRSFIMIEGQYFFKDQNACDQKLQFDLKMLTGICIEKYGDSKSNGLGFGAGSGINVRLAPRLELRGQLGFLGVKFENSSDLNTNVVASIGAVIKVQRNYYPE